mgnify:CR=1 FL=1
MIYYKIEMHHNEKTFESLSEKNLDLMNGIKKVFDPKNILNPHKVAQR